MNLRSLLTGIWLVLIMGFLVQVRISAQEVQGEKYNSKALEDLSAELTAKLSLSKSQEDRITNILTDLQRDLSGPGGLNSVPDSDEQPDVEPIDSKARQDQTDVKGENNKDLSGDDDAGINTGTARTKNETDDNNVTGRSEPAVVSFERARIDADSRIEELLTPEQAIQYGKIKSDWWDKVREKIQPGGITK